MFNLKSKKKKKGWIKKTLVSVLILGMVVYFLPLIPEAQAATQVATPTFSPNNSSGIITITTKTKISLSTATAGAKIYYTINGSTPTTSSYLYDPTIGVDFQPVNPSTGLELAMYIKIYTVHAIAVKSGYSNSKVAVADFNVTNKDQTLRNILNNYLIGVNKNDCWTADKKNCTSLLGMNDKTKNEIVSLAQACNKWVSPTGSYANLCQVFITGGTEAGHAGTGTCSHLGGGKADLRSLTNLDKYITNPSYFTKQSKNRGDGAPLYVRKSDGAVYADERGPNFGTGPHWDITYPSCVQ